MATYKCVICSYEYDEARGIPESGIAAGTKWEDLPEDWKCPVCSATKENFELVGGAEEETIVEEMTPASTALNTYKCVICSYEYDEARGIPESGIAAGTKWEDLPEDWKCPVCSATKENFELVGGAPEAVTTSNTAPVLTEQSTDYSNAQLSAIFANLAKGCEKQFLPTEMELLKTLENYYNTRVSLEVGDGYEEISSLIKSDVDSTLKKAEKTSKDAADRGALRALTWSGKVSMMVQSLVNNKDNSVQMIMEGKSVHICEICGFMIIAEDAPDVCPVCKVPKTKIRKVGAAV